MEAAEREALQLHSGRSLLSTLTIEIPGDLTCVQQASYPEEGLQMWILPLYLHVNKKFGDDDDDDDDDNDDNIKKK